MARWEDVRRAILAKDIDGTRDLWMQMVELSPENLAPFIDAADLSARQPGGKRHAVALLEMLLEGLTEQGRQGDTIGVFAKLAELAPENLTIRPAVISIAREAYAERADLESMLDLSGVLDVTSDVPESIRNLERLLRIQSGVYVFHKSGWGVGKIVEYLPDRGRCVIDFRTRPGHEMDIELAAKLLERLEEDDIRVQAMIEPRGLRARAKTEPLEMLRQGLLRYNSRARLKNIKDVLVPDAVAPSTWSTWWKAAKKAALLDPRFEVGDGRDPVLEFHDVAQADFRTQVERALKRSPTDIHRQKVVRDFLALVKEDEEARKVLVETVEKELARTPEPAGRVGWELTLASLTDRDPQAGLRQALAEAHEPAQICASIPDDLTRGQALEALLHATDEGPKMVQALALDDDPVAAEVGAKGFKKVKQPELLPELLDAVNKKPAMLPNLYAWYLKGLRKNRWEGHEYEPYPLVVRVLKVLDAVEYRSRRKSSATDKKAVSSLVDFLGDKNCKLIQEAADVSDETKARHLLVMLGQNRGLKGRSLQKMQNVLLRAHPSAMRESSGGAAQEDEAPAATGALYMTDEGLAKLKAEQKQLENEDMPKNRAEIARAREFGDLKENAEYHAAREKQGMLEAKLEILRSDIARAVPITSDIVRTEAVSVGTRVKLKDSDGSIVTYTLLGPPDAELDKGIINYQTPIAQAMMGQRVGDPVRLDVDGAVRELTVLSIESSL